MRLLAIPAFLVLALSSRDGQDTAAVIVFAAIGWADYLDGFAARLTGQYSRLGALLDPIVDRLLVVSGMFVAYDFSLLPRWAIVLAIARELFMLVVSRYGLSRGIELRINWP
ncbi:MAG: CDP-alcohol phosphatidyltransferase family protein, partial [Solirubrobacteraceae bacterium]